MSGRVDADTLLSRALVGDAARAGVAIAIDATAVTRWASATFVGARHRLTLSGLRCAATDTWLAGLAEADLPLRGHLVADLVIAGQAQSDGGFTATLEVLTVEEA
jgi:hypothetical protein